MSLIKSIKDKITDLPMPSVVVARLLTVIQDEHHSLKDVVKIIENDPALTTKVLKVANSAAFYRGKGIDTLNRAVAHLGERFVLGIAIGSSTSAVFKSSMTGYGSSADEYWNHSLQTAIASKELVNFSKIKVAGDKAFTIGLLHDIGKSILSQFLGSSPEVILRGYDVTNEDYLDAEKNMLGIDHAEVGGEIAEYWNLPSSICNVIRHHHKPANAPKEDRAMAYLVHVGDMFAMMSGAGTGTDMLAYRMDPDFSNFLDLTKKDTSRIILYIQDEFQLAKNLMSSNGEK